MTKKDYIRLVSVIRDLAPSVPAERFGLFVSAIADFLQADNPRFDRERFITAIYTEEVSS